MQPPAFHPMSAPNDNRAVSALFRVFGGAGERGVADVHVCSPSRGLHAAEYRAFGVLVPLTLCVAVGAWLSAWLGNGGWWLAVPSAFLVLNVLPFLLGVGSRSAQWWWTLVACVLWAVGHRDASGVVGLFSYIWMGIGVMSVAASMVLAWQAAMRWSGWPGITWRIFLLVLLHAGAIFTGFKFGWEWGVACAAAIAGAFCWAVLRPGSQWLGPVYRTMADGGILITIDDGPDPHDTPLLLDLLDRHHTKAIFFMIGEKVRKHPELAREVVRRGHEIGNHTLTHPHQWFWGANALWTWGEIADCQQVIEEVTGKSPRLFRAPCGHRNLFTHPIASVLGLEVMAWSRRGYDAVEKDAGKVLARILPGLTAGDIVLLHESTPIAPEVLAGVLEKVSPL